jgi:hypothetical protein
LIADLADLEELLDIELVDRFDVHSRGSWSTGSGRHSKFQMS